MNGDWSRVAWDCSKEDLGGERLQNHGVESTPLESVDSAFSAKVEEVGRVSRISLSGSTKGADLLERRPKTSAGFLPVVNIVGLPASFQAWDRQVSLGISTNRVLLPRPGWTAGTTLAATGLFPIENYAV